MSDRYSTTESVVILTSLTLTVIFLVALLIGWVRGRSSRAVTRLNLTGSALAVAPSGAVLHPVFGVVILLFGAGTYALLTWISRHHPQAVTAWEETVGRNL